MTNVGKIKMMSSRNNNFSNRGQKLKINVMNITNNKTELMVTQSTSNNSNNNFLITIGILSGLLSLMVIITLYVNRDNINNRYKSCRKNIKRNTSSYV